MTAEEATASWASFDRMWKAVRSDPKRMELLCGEHFLVENFTSGTCPLPYTAHHRLKIEWKDEGGRKRIVVNRQAVLPLQDDPDTPDYHAPNLDEDELVFDERWRLMSKRTWTWRGQEAVGADRQSVFCYPPLAYRREGEQFVCIEGAEKGKAWALDDSLPPTRAAELLFRVGADFAKGKVIATRPIPAAGAQEVTFMPAEPRWGNKKLTVEIGDYNYAPSVGEYGWSANQCDKAFKTASRDDFRKALRKFVTDLKIEKLADKDGRAVEPPLGLNILGESGRQPSPPPAAR